MTDYVLAIDAGSTETGYCLVQTSTYNPIQFGKIPNEEVLNVIKESAQKYNSLHIAIEQFAFYGSKNPIGSTTIDAITWNGKFIREAEILGVDYTYVFRREEKMNLCKTMRCGDKEIRQALINRFAKHDLKKGKGTKKNPDFFYGFAADMWSAFAIAITYLDKQKGQKVNHSDSSN